MNGVPTQSWDTVDAAAFMSFTTAPGAEHTRHDLVGTRTPYNFSLGHGQEWMLLPFSGTKPKKIPHEAGLENAIFCQAASHSRRRPWFSVSF